MARCFTDVEILIVLLNSQRMKPISDSVFTFSVRFIVWLINLYKVTNDSALR